MGVMGLGALLREGTLAPLVQGRAAGHPLTSTHRPDELLVELHPGPLPAPGHSPSAHRADLLLCDKPPQISGLRQPPSSVAFSGSGLCAPGQQVERPGAHRAAETQLSSKWPPLHQLPCPAPWCPETPAHGERSEGQVTSGFPRLRGSHLRVWPRFGGQGPLRAGGSCPAAHLAWCPPSRS